jgi:hypothetical protein
VSALTARLLPRLLALDRRVVRLLLGALLLVVALECWLLVLRGPLTEWRSLLRQREASAAAVPVGALRAENERQRHAVEQAERALREADLPHADEEMVLHLITTLAPPAQRHGIQFGQIKASGRRAERDMQVVSFEGEARGSYLALTGWLAEVEPQIAPLRASELQISSSGEESAVSLRVKFSAYLPGADAPGVPK